MAMVMQCDRCKSYGPEGASAQKLEEIGWRHVSVNPLDSWTRQTFDGMKLGGDICAKCMIALKYLLDPGTPDSISTENC